MYFLNGEEKMTIELFNKYFIFLFGCFCIATCINGAITIWNRYKDRKDEQINLPAPRVNNHSWVQPCFICSEEIRWGGSYIVIEDQMERPAQKGMEVYFPPNLPDEQEAYEK